MLVSGRAVRVMNELFNPEPDIYKKDKVTIIIDPGHGGRDPGKVGVNAALEKDINLQIAMRLRSLLEENDINVIMTRSEDIGLYSEDDPNKKRADLKNRIDIINSSEALLAVSIHQNSFVEEYVKGAQVFYYTKSDQGKVLADIIQEQLREIIKDGNHRQAKSNDIYYMLKMSECPLVIVECGYLSNSKESSLLVNEDYQEKVAWAIHLGIMCYLNSSSEPKKL